MNETLLKDRPMTGKDTQIDGAKDVPADMANLEHSLTSAAKAVGLSRNTLRAAADKGELPHSKNSKDHYVIIQKHLLQWKINRDADLQRDRLRTDFVRPSNPRPDVRSDRTSEPSERPSLDGTGDGVKVMLLEQEKTALETRIRDKDKLISKLEIDVDSWRDHAKKLQDQAASATRLLEHHKTAETAETEISDGVGQGGNSSAKWWLTSAAMALIIFGVVFVWQDEITSALQNSTAIKITKNNH